MRMRRISALLLAAGLLTGVATAQSSPPKTLYAELNARYSKNIGSPTDGRLRPSKKFPGTEQAYLPAIEPSSHAANLVVLKNGDILCFWFTGTWEGHSGVGIAMSRLKPGSRQWTKPRMIDSKAGWSYQNPVPFQAPNGTVWLFHSEQRALQGETHAHVLVLKSTNNGKTWTKPKMLFPQPGAFTRNPVVIMPDGGWLLPMYRAVGHWWQNYPVIKITHNQGKTWTTCHLPKATGLVQPDVVLLPDHHYVAFLRSRNATWIYRSTSSDGCHWTKPVPTSLPNNNSSIQVRMLRNHDMVMAFNNSPRIMVRGHVRSGPRKPLTLAISSDYGKHWRWLRNIATGRPWATTALEHEKKPGRDAYSYPSVVQDPDGKIDVAFTYRRETIKFMRLSESWIKQGPMNRYLQTSKSHSK